MKKTIRRMLTVCGAAAMMLSAAQIIAFADGDVKEVALHMPTVYDLPDAPMVEDAINQITEEKYGIHLNLTYVTMGNWQQQSNLLFTSDEADVIAVFMTPLSTYVKNGQLEDLTDYYANASDEFKQIWSEDEMKGTSVDGKIYAIPNLRNFGNIMGLNIDEDIAAEFGIENGQKLTMEEVDEFLTKAHEKYPDRYLTDSLKAHGIEMRRFKTGTPARIDKRSIDFSKMEEQFGDERVVPFSFTTDPESVQIDQASCWLTYTNEKTHEIIRENLDRSPLYSGMIEGTGPRYCPSIEDKVVRFADKNRHQVFIEPEGLNTNEMYVGGMSSSLPEDVQYAMYRTVAGLEHAVIVRNAYAIEYDCINPKELDSSLEFKKLPGLFSGGQFNGSSGYEEAAAQGLVAGINAAMKVLGREPLILDRSECYIGVLIDDLVTKENREPYRMMTSRAEYRLLLRQDNADLRLTKKGYEVGLISEERYQALLRKEKEIEEEIKRVEHTNIGANEKVQAFLEKHGSTPLKSGTTLGELIRRPELSYEELAEIDENRPELRADVQEQVNIEIKYEGYIQRQKRQVEQFKKLETKKIPKDIDYDDVYSLRLEAKQKLKEYEPTSIGQASRISGVSPADISVLLVYLESHRG